MEFAHLVTPESRFGITFVLNIALFEGVSIYVLVKLLDRIGVRSEQDSAVVLHVVYDVENS